MAAGGAGAEPWQENLQRHKQAAPCGCQLFSCFINLACVNSPRPKQGAGMPTCPLPPRAACLQEAPASEQMVLEGLEDGFHRLIAHGLCEYYSLPSHSRQLADGSKEVVVRRRAPEAATPPPQQQPAAGGEEGEDEVEQEWAAAAAADEARRGGGGALPISCSDILHILVDEAQPLTPQVGGDSRCCLLRGFGHGSVALLVMLCCCSSPPALLPLPLGSPLQLLHHAYFNTHADSSSEAGDPHHHAARPASPPHQRSPHGHHAHEHHQHQHQHQEHHQHHSTHQQQQHHRGQHQQQQEQQPMAVG